MLLFAIVARQPRFPVNEDSQRSVFKSGARCCHDDFRNGTRTTFFVQFAHVIVTAIHSLVNKGTKLSWYGKEKISFITPEDWDVFKSKLISIFSHSNWKKAVDICWVLNIPMLPWWQLLFSWGPNDYVALFVFARTGQRPHVEYDLAWSQPWFFTTRSYHVATLDLSIWCLSHRQPWISSFKHTASASALACLFQSAMPVRWPAQLGCTMLQVSEKSPWYLTFQLGNATQNRPSKNCDFQAFPFPALKAPTVESARFSCRSWTVSPLSLGKVTTFPTFLRNLFHQLSRPDILLRDHGSRSHQVSYPVAACACWKSHEDCCKNLRRISRMILSNNAMLGWLFWTIILCYILTPSWNQEAVRAKS